MMDYIFEMEGMTILLENGGAESMQVEYHKLRMAGYAGKDAGAAGVQPGDSPECSGPGDEDDTDENAEDEQK